MIRTTVVGSWPPEARFQADLKRYDRGEIPPEQSDHLLEEVATIAMAQQRACGLDEF